MVNEAATDPNAAPASSPSPDPSDSPASANAGAADAGASHEGGDKGAGTEAGAGDAAGDGGDSTGAGALPWAEATDLDGLVEVEPVKAHITSRIETATKDALKEGRVEALKRVQPVADNNARTLDSIDASAKTIVKSWNEWAKSGAATKDEVSEVFTEHKEALAALAGVQTATSNAVGRIELIGELADHLESPDLKTEFQKRVADVHRGLADAELPGELAEAIADALVKPVKDELKEAKAEIAQQKVTAKTIQRDGNGSPARVDGKAAGAPLTKAQVDAMSQKEINATSDELLDAALKRG